MCGVGRHAEAELEVHGMPGRGVLGEMAQPVDEVAAQRRDLVLPHAQDRRREVFVELRRDGVERVAERALGVGQPGDGDGQRAGVGQRPQRLGLHAVGELAARQRVELLERRDLAARFEAQDRGEKEAIGAGGEVLQRRR